MMQHTAEQIVQHIRSLAAWIGVEVLGRLLYYTGVLYAIGIMRKYLGRPRLLVPMYHRVKPAKSNGEPVLLDIEDGIDVDLLDRHMRIMSWFGTFLPLTEAYDYLQTPGCRPRTLIAVTFDDGYRDNLGLASPVLERHGVPPTVFPVVRVLNGGRPLWWDELSHLLRNGSIDGEGMIPYVHGIPELTPNGAEAVKIGSGADRVAIAQFLANRLLPLPMRQREGILDLLAERLDASGPTSKCRELYLDWDGLRKLAESGCEVGGHTIDHPVLTAEDPLTREEQISACRQSLEESLAVAVRSFAYPNGRCDEGDCETVKRAGFRLAVTVEPGVNYQHTDRYRLRRVPLGEERPFHLALKLAFYGLVHR